LQSFRAQEDLSSDVRPIPFAYAVHYLQRAHCLDTLLS
jgi:hypothetical protein